MSDYFLLVSDDDLKQPAFLEALHSSL